MYHSEIREFDLKWSGNFISWVGWELWYNWKEPNKICFLKLVSLKSYSSILELLLLSAATVMNCFFNPLSASATKWSNTRKQFVGKLPTNCLSVFDHFMRLALKGSSLPKSFSMFRNLQVFQMCYIMNNHYRRLNPSSKHEKTEII